MRYVKDGIYSHNGRLFVELSEESQKYNEFAQSEEILTEQQFYAKQVKELKAKLATTDPRNIQEVAYIEERIAYYTFFIENPIASFADWVTSL